MSAFLRFPHTPHLAWLGTGKPRDDKVLSPHEARDLLSHEVFVEEKVDGSNVGFSVDAHGALRAQNRGSYLDLGALQGQWKSLGRWLAVRRSALEEVLSPDLALFGEWCYAVHTIRYTRLPDWFLAFDVYDRVRDEFWGVRKRNDLVRALGLAVVPQRAQGRVTLDQLKHIMSSSELASGPAEGLYIRLERANRLLSRAKLVRAEFVQTIEQHWSKRRLEPNQLATDSESARLWH